MNRGRFLLAAVAGAASVLGFAPFMLAPIAIIALAFLFRLWRIAASPREAAWTGFGFGLGLFLAGVSWVYVSLNTFGMMPAPIAVIATFGFCATLAALPTIAGFLTRRIGGNVVLSTALVAPALWTLTEWARGWLFTGFPWLNLGYSQIDTPLLGYAPVAGVYGITLFTAFSAGAIAALLDAPTRARGALVLAVIAIYVGGSVLRTIEWTQPVGAGVEVALIQGNVSQDMKFVPGRYEEIAETYRKLVTASDAKLIVLPETALPRFFDAIDPEYLRDLQAHARKNAGDVLIGVPTGDPRRAYYNTVLSLGVSPVQLYSKSHLVPFGEFVPLAFGWIEHVLSIPLSSFSRGSADQKPLAVAGEKVAINICYEDAFGAEIIRQLPEATMLVNVSNVAWFGDSLAPSQHLQISRMRAHETGRPMLRATNTGVTAIIDHRTGAIQSLPTFQQGVLRGKVQGFEGATPYVRHGDMPAIAIALALLLAGALIGRRARA